MNHRTALAALESDLVRARDLARTFDRGPALDSALDSALARLRVFDGLRARLFVRDSDSALADFRDLVRSLHGIHAHARDLNRAWSDEIPGYIDDAIPGHIDMALMQLKYLRALHPHLAVTAGGQLMPGRVSRGLLALAVRLLPAAQRSRYDDEYHSELGELRRRERWGYVLRVLVGAWELRRALVEPVRTPDSDVARRAER